MKFKKKLFYLWVLICVKVGKDVTNSEVECLLSCFSENLSENGSIKAILCEKYAVNDKVLRKQKI